MNSLRVVVEEEEMKLRSRVRSSTRDTPCQVYFSLLLALSCIHFILVFDASRTRPNWSNCNINGSFPASYLGSDS